jgi:4-diphosphocytidyl-2-C-methyl-D-erythritol kinase
VVRALTLRPPAKINLTLHVGGVRRDGFHDVQTVMQSIGWADRLVGTARPGPFTLVIRGTGAPVDRTNLVWRAADMLWRAIGRSDDPRDVHFTLEKQVPAGAGLGGGSADAAAALVILNRLWRSRLSVGELAALAAGIGTDVPFFLLGGTALGVGRGDDLYPVADIRRFGVVLLTPSFGVATADAYHWCDEDRRTGGGSEPVESAGLDVGWAGRGLRLVNDLTGPVSRRHPEIGEMIAACRRAGAVATGMTGSGSAVFGLFAPPAASAAARRLRRPEWLVIATRTLSRREAGRRMSL